MADRYEDNTESLFLARERRARSLATQAVVQLRTLGFDASQSESGHVVIPIWSFYDSGDDLHGRPAQS